MPAPAPSCADRSSSSESASPQVRCSPPPGRPAGSTDRSPTTGYPPTWAGSAPAWRWPWRARRSPPGWRARSLGRRRTRRPRRAPSTSPPRPCWPSRPHRSQDREGWTSAPGSSRSSGSRCSASSLRWWSCRRRSTRHRSTRCCGPSGQVRCGGWATSPTGSSSTTCSPCWWSPDSSTSGRSPGTSGSSPRRRSPSPSRSPGSVIGTSSRR